MIYTEYMVETFIEIDEALDEYLALKRSDPGFVNHKQRLFGRLEMLARRIDWAELHKLRSLEEIRQLEQIWEAS